MKVILCTPYKDDREVAKGGINQWGKNIIEYYEENGSDVELLPISFDRHISFINATNTFGRIKNGLKDQITPIRKTKKVIREEKPDVVHICTSAGLGSIRDYLIVSYAKRYHIKSVLHLHFGRLPELSQKNNWEWKLLKAVIKKCDAVIPMNRPTEVALKDNGFSKVRYLPNPLSNRIVEQIINLRGTISRIPKRLLYVGHVYETKGLIELVEGCRDIEGAKIRIVGKYTREIYNKLISVGDKSNNADYLEFIGEISHEEVLKEFMEADLFVFPSYTEGFPNVILEAMACGCPIIASNVGAIPEMLDTDNEPCGICILPKSSKEVHDAVTSLINNNEQKELFAERAMRRVNSMYSMPVVWKELVNIWKY